MICVNQTRPHCVNQLGKTQSIPLAEWHGMGTALYVWICLNSLAYTLAFACCLTNSTQNYSTSLNERYSSCPRDPTPQIESPQTNSAGQLNKSKITYRRFGINYRSHLQTPATTRVTALNKEFLISMGKYTPSNTNVTYISLRCDMFRLYRAIIRPIKFIQDYDEIKQRNAYSQYGEPYI
jgi:hypothetical protein